MDCFLLQFNNTKKKNYIVYLWSHVIFLINHPKWLAFGHFCNTDDVSVLLYICHATNSQVALYTNTIIFLFSFIFKATQNHFWCYVLSLLELYHTKYNFSLVKYFDIRLCFFLLYCIDKVFSLSIFCANGVFDENPILFIEKNDWNYWLKTTIKHQII